jgi:hypothetical protein
MSCKNDDDQTTDLLNLADHIQEYETHLSDEVIACSAGRPDGLDGQPEFPTSTFFLPKSGATDFKYFETETSLNTSKKICPFPPSLMAIYKSLITTHSQESGWLWLPTSAMALYIAQLQYDSK